MPSFIYILLIVAVIICALLVIGMLRAGNDADRLMEEEHQYNMRNTPFRDTMRAGQARADEFRYANGE